MSKDGVPKQHRSFIIVNSCHPSSQIHKLNRLFHYLICSCQNKEVIQISGLLHIATILLLVLLWQNKILRSVLAKTVATEEPATRQAAERLNWRTTYSANKGDFKVLIIRVMSAVSACVCIKHNKTLTTLASHIFHACIVTWRMGKLGVRQNHNI